MGLILKRDGWQAMSYNPSTVGIFILEVDLAGSKRYYATNQKDIREFSEGPFVNAVGAILNSPSFKMTVNPYTREFNVTSMDFAIMSVYFPVTKVISSGQSLSGIKANVYWMIDGAEFVLDQAFMLVKGYMDNFRYNEQESIIYFKVSDTQLSGDKMFPPRAVTNSTFDMNPASIVEDSAGKCYPVVIGDVKKMPVVDISADGGRFLVMDDPIKQMTGTVVTAIYDGDNALSMAGGGQGSATDLEGSTYWYADVSGDEATSQDVTADVAGPCGSLVEAIVYLLTAYSDKRDMFDLTTLRSLSDLFYRISFSLVFNQMMTGGVVQAIKERLIRELPLSIIQLGEKFYFQHLLWGRDISKTLSTDKNIILTLESPTEIGRAEMANSFVVQGGISGLRGDAQSAVSRNKNNDAMCLLSVQRYGELGKREISVPDLVDEDGATWLMNWVVETFTKKRIKISYLCTFDTIDVNLWDTVEVYDADLNWNHGPLFKVVGITYEGTNGIGLDLLSIDDYFDVYGVNINNPSTNVYPISFSLSGVTP